jgi:hypothetical protein
MVNLHPVLDCPLADPHWAPAHHLSPLGSSTEPRHFCGWLLTVISFHSGFRPASTSHRISPMSLSSSCSLLRVVRPQLSVVAVVTTHTFRLPDCHLMSWHLAHASGQRLLKKTFVLVCFSPWRFSVVKLYSRRHWASGPCALLGS